MGVLLLGTVVGVHMLGDSLVLYYSDHRSVVVTYDGTDIVVADHKVPAC